MVVFELLGNLAIQFGKEVFVKNLESIFMQYLTNTASAVREIGIQKSKEIGEKLKSEWILANYIPKVIENYNIDK